MTAVPGYELSIEGMVRRGSFVLDVALEAHSGQVLAVLGPNGSGKSTLLLALAGLLPLAGGRVTLGGQVLDDAGTGMFVDPADRRIGMVFQSYRLFDHLSVLDNVAFAPRSRGARRHAARTVAAQWLDRLDLRDLAGRRPSALSGGQAQQVALARALASEPAALLLDEPMAALDARTRLDVQGRLRGHLTGFAGPCVLVTHDPRDALVLADELVILEAGRVVQRGAPAEVARRPATEYVATLVGLNLYAGVAAGTTVEVDGGGRFVVASHDASGPVRIAVRPSAVVITTERPEHASPRNVWPGVVEGVTTLADRVRLDIDATPRVVVDVTPAAVAELGLAPGRQVWLSVKATDIEVYPHDG